MYKLHNIHLIIPNLFINKTIRKKIVDDDAYILNHSIFHVCKQMLFQDIWVWAAAKSLKIIRFSQIINWHSQITRDSLSPNFCQWWIQYFDYTTMSLLRNILFSPSGTPLNSDLVENGNSFFQVVNTKIH